MKGSIAFSQLPQKKSLTTNQTWSIVVAVLMGVMSLAGLIFSERIYLTPEQIQSYRANDLVNLLIGLPSLLGSIWLARHGKLIGLLLWPGALLYVVYNYMAYIFGMPFRWITMVFAALVLLSVYLVFDLLRSMDLKAIQDRLAGTVFEKFSGGVLALFGVIFSFMAAGVITEALASQATITPEVGVSIADIVLSVLLIVGGIALFLRKPLGYASGLGLLFGAATLFIGLIALLLLQPILTGSPFALTDVIVVFIMSLVCFIPLGLYVRGVVSKGNSI